MKKPIAALAALVVAAGASAGAYFAAKNKKDKDDKAQAEKAADNNLFSFDSDSINKATFTFGGDTYTAELRDSVWTLTSGGDFALDQDYINNVCTYMSYLTASTSFPADDSKTASYGLDSAGVIELSDGTQSYKINVGGISPTNDFYYVTLDDRDKVYAVSSLYGSVLKTSRMMLRSKNLVPYEDYNIAQITLEHGGETVYDLTYDSAGGTWSLPPEYSDFAFDQSSVDSIVTVITRLKASLEGMREEAPSDLSVYGLDKPEYTVTVRGLDGTQRTILINTKYDQIKNYSSVYVKETDQVMIMLTGDFSLVDKTPYTFIVKEFTNIDYGSASRIEFTLGDISADFELDTEAGSGKLNGTGFDLNDSSIKLAIQNIVASVGIERLTGIDIEAEPDVENMLLSAQLTAKDGSSMKYELADAGNGQCYVFKNGKYTGALVSAEILSGKNSLAYFYDEFLEAAKMK